MTESERWRLDEHGDEEERAGWPHLRQLVPSYETFWRRYIVPQTFRELQPQLLLLRPGAPRVPENLTP